MNREGLTKKSVFNVGVFVGVYTFAVIFLWYYLYTSIGKMPFMDYYLSNNGFIEKALTQFPQIETIISIPHRLHWNPLDVLSQYFFIRFFGCDNRAYVYAGMIFSCFIILFIMWIYKQIFYSDKILLNFFGLILCVMPIINLNQWEIFTLYCNFTFMFRVFVYFIMFYVLDRMLHQYTKDKKIYVYLIGFAIINIAVILLISQAYFLGLIAVEVVAIVIDFLYNKNKERFAMYVIIFLSAFLGFVAYYVTLDRNEMSMVGKGRDVLSILLDYLKGIIIMLGSTIIPSSLSAENLSVCCGIGVAILGLSSIAVWLFYKYSMYEKTYFPILCLVYAFSNIIVIISGRMYSYGLMSLTSSRYVVETTIGLLGIVQIYWYCICDTVVEKKIKTRMFSVSVLVGIFGMLCWSNSFELKIAPARKAYNDALEEMALDIDNVSDAELAIFQAKPDDVREVVAVMKEYHLLLWKE